MRTRSQLESGRQGNSTKRVRTQHDAEASPRSSLGARANARHAPLLVDGRIARAALVCMASFALLDERRASALRESVLTIRTWKMSTHVVGITQNASLLRWQLDTVDMDDVVEVREVRDPLQLPWEHRRVIDQLVPRAASETTASQKRARRFDLFVYLEDDVLLSWRTVQAWAADEALLAQASGGLFHRGLYRYELCGWGHTPTERKVRSNAVSMPRPSSSPDPCKLSRR